MTKRTVIRLVSFSLAALALMSGIAIWQFRSANYYRNQVDMAYQRAFYDLVDYAKTVDTSLEKGIHATSAQNIVRLSNEIWAEAGSAKAALGQLPLSGTQLDNLSRFMSQVGNYTITLANKALEGEELTEQEQQTLDQLSQYSRQLCTALVEMEAQVNSGEISIQQLSRVLPDSTEVPDFCAGFQDIEAGFSELPSLIYDGPFSDHLAQRESLLLKDAAQITEEEARQKASALMNVAAEQLIASEGIHSTIPTYSFSWEDENGNFVSVDITQQGGYPLYLIDSRSTGDAMLSTEWAVRQAKDFLAQNGFGDMQESYYMEEDGILTINFAPVQDGYLCYPDLIEVGISMDDGHIVLLEASGYIMNHHEREIPTIKKTRSQVEKTINDRLTPQEYTLAVIPTDGGGEVFVHGFLCTNSDDRKYLTYFNTQTGEEERIFLLLEDESGTLAM